MIYRCGQSARRELVLIKPDLNGIDYVEVPGPPGAGTSLAVTFLKPAAGLDLLPANIVLEGGAPVTVTAVAPATADPYTVTVQLDRTGDFSLYTLRLAAQTGGEKPEPAPEPPDGLDPVLSSVTFSFKAGFPAPADPLPAAPAAAPWPPPPDINYLARDYDGFRQVLLDRLAVTVPGWSERHAADLGVTLAEALAYAADHLSYQQDAVGTEAYLGTTRSRISVRRHARLVGYQLSEGCAARTLVTVTVAGPGTTQPGAGGGTIPLGTLFYPAVPGLPAAGPAAGPMAARLAGTGPVFTALTAVSVRAEQNVLSFYPWGDNDCCLPSGATSATLQGQLSTLAPGTLLVFEEVLGPGTGQPGDADPAHRCAVMLTDVRTLDYRGRPLTDPATGIAVTEITWASADALPFPLWLSRTVNGTPVANISLALGNVVPVQHGTLVAGEQLAPPPPPTGRYYPPLSGAPLSFQAPLPPLPPLPPGPDSSAAACLAPDAARAAAAVTLTSTGTDGVPRPWLPRPDLLSSTSGDRHFVPEIDGDATAWLRFGDGEHGLPPTTDLTFQATYWVGNGGAGNIGRDTLGHAVLAPPAPADAAPITPPQVARVRNPLPVTSGADPESADHARLVAPFAFKQQQRCVTEDDYSQQAAALPGVRQARGTLRWTGSWYTAFVSVDPGPGPGVVSGLSQLPMLGTDLAADGAVIVGLRIALAVSVDAGHFRGDVYAALMARFTGPDGLLSTVGASFGQTVYASPLIAAAQAVDGVAAVVLGTFSRMDAPWVDGTVTGFISLGRLEIARCDNDPDRLDHGLFTITLDGGK